MNIINPYIFGGYDADALAYITAAGITDVTKKNAINTFVLDLKAASIWTRFYAIYPLIDGTASAHKWNLKNPVDSDAAFRLTFSGTITHDASGMAGNGSTGYADTYLTPNAVMSQDDAHISCYINDNSTGNYGEMGAGDSGAADVNSVHIFLNYAGIGYYRNNSTGFSSVVTSATNGFYLNTRSASGVFTAYRNGSSILSGSNASTGLSSNNINICRHNSVPYYSVRRFAFASIGMGLDNTQQSNLYTAVQALETSLGRNV